MQDQMRDLIRRLIDNAPDIDNPIVKSMREDAAPNAQRRFLECQVVLQGGYAMAGILTYAVDFAGETLQLTAVGMTPDKKPVLADHYFTYDAVSTIVVGRKMPEQFVKPVRNGGPLIVPGA